MYFMITTLICSKLHKKQILLSKEHIIILTPKYNINTLKFMVIEIKTAIKYHINKTEIKRGIIRVLSNEKCSKKPNILYTIIE